MSKKYAFLFWFHFCALKFSSLFKNLDFCFQTIGNKGKGLDGIVEDDMLFNTKLSKTICPLLQGNRTTLHEFHFNHKYSMMTIT